MSHSQKMAALTIAFNYLYLSYLILIGFAADFMILRACISDPLAFHVGVPFNQVFCDQ